MVKKFVEKAPYWACENLDLNAPIVEEGMAYLLEDGSTDYIEDGKVPADTYIRVTESEYKAFYNRKGFVFRGNLVEVYKGRMKGYKGIAKSFFRYDVAGTYGKVYTDYIVFEDGSKTNILNCCINGTRLISEYYGAIRVGGRI